MAASEVRAWLRFTAAYERAAARRLRREFARTAQELADLYDRSGETGLGFGLARHEARLERVLEAVYRAVVEPAAVRFLRTLPQRKKGDPKPNPRWADAIARWIRAAALARAVQIAQTTRTRVAAALADLVAAEALTPQAARKAVQDAAGGTIGRQRAAIIARTEVNAAANKAQIEAAESVSLPHVIEWLSVEDARTRPEHAAADGQQIEPGGRFTVGGVAMAHPGDPAAPARLTVNCRCATRVRIKLDELDD